ncbi:DgyrCDS1527 [Dimorphilus gyrociliatus]|uniref:DgyrCDS1527 n=2 Tax=Dimorphilus gyrociliatus TaxID=2664684 RepID=A0A7I8V7N1_9ANNE|nr:DgyrCDS1527 [Dimorphilus gyrociliatus]
MDRLQCSPSSSTDSISSEEEEKLRRLFEACDRDGDGYIDMEDLKEMCHQLHLEDSVEEIIVHFNHQGLYNRISYEQFARCGMQLKPEIELQECRPPPLPPRRTVTFSNVNQYIDEAALAQNSLYSMLEKSDPAVLKHITQRVECSKTLQLCNSLHLASLQSLIAEKVAVKQEISVLENDRSRYEERVTELQSVIAELRKKITTSSKHIDVIREEEEEENDSVEVEQPNTNLGASAQVEKDNMNNLHIKYSTEPHQSLPNLHYSLSGEDDVRELKSQLHLIRIERDELKKRIDGSNTSSSNHYESIDQLDTIQNSKSCSSPVKIAEKKKLKTVFDRTSLLGSDLTSCNSGLESACIAEQLVHDWRESSKIQEMIQGIGAGNLPDRVVKEFEIEVERLNSKVEHIKAQNDVLSLSLSESKAHSDRLSQLLAKYESNQTALQIALSNAEQAIECFEVLLAFATADRQLLSPNCRVSDSEKSLNSRRDAERRAKRLLNNRHRQRTTQSAPWESISTNSSTTTNTSSGAETDEESKLKDMIADLKLERSAVKSTVVDLESVHNVDPPPTQNLSTQRLDLENAVLVQELLAVKEERAELRSQIHNLHKEKTALQVQLYGKNELDNTNVEQLQKEMTNGTLNSTLTLADLPPDVDEVFKREKKLKNRVHELVSTLERMSKNAEARHQQSTDLVNELKNANSALITAFEKAKKKYQAKIKKLETKVQTVTGLCEAQVKSLKQRIAQLEHSVNGGVLPPTSQSPQPAPSETSL